MMAVFKREFRAYFQTPTGYAFLSLFLFVSGIYYGFGNVLNRSSDYPVFVSSVLFLCVFGVPALTMRLFAEEKRQKTDQLLLTSPVTVPAIIVGKYLAALAVFLLAVAVIALYSIPIAIWGDLAVPQSIGALLGFVLAGAAYLAIGLLISTVTENQAVAAVATVIALLLLQLVEPIRSSLPRDFMTGAIFAAIAILAFVYVLYLAVGNLVVGAVALAAFGGAAVIVGLLDPAFYTGIIAEALGLFAIAGRQQRLVAGVLALNDAVYYLSFIFIVLFTAIRFVEKRRWA